MSPIDPITAKKLAERLKKLYGYSVELSGEIYGNTPPSLLITEISYPKVSIGVLLSQEENSELYDNPYFWSEKEYPIEKIAEMRMKLINARRISDVYIPKKCDIFYNDLVESELSTKSVDIEAKLKKITPNTKISKLFAYYGLKGVLQRFKITTNPKIPKIVYQLYEDNVKAENGIVELYNKGFSDYYIARLLSLGIFGIKNNRKLVPSRWAITAVQNNIINYLKKDIRHFNQINDVYLFNYKFYGNDFYILLFPGDVKFELIEAILPGSAYNLHYNFAIIGRDDASGGFYAAKLSYLEFLDSLGKKGSCVVFRIVTREYLIPLGVWVVREGVKRAFSNVIGKYSNVHEALEVLNRKLEKYNISVYKLKKYSNILKQKSIKCWIT